ncbi:hypothetical protein BD289DRAFT_379440 [Coniella lustricola]|uniref:Zn(2)-C6 fungal-type domain-containing protein n=1 Tax=Coniella lustricola TaxID=2025994 RepID=A0A2T2ZSP0_9PEZI|nr:hypothetical protein BD289DRAFT_379440 [Coniella lustricola]
MTKVRRFKAQNNGRTNAKPIRITRACDMCRLKKTKCDGERPCGACAQRDFSCTYDGSQTKDGIKASTTAGEKAREARSETAASLDGGTFVEQAPSGDKPSRSQRMARTNASRATAASSGPSKSTAANPMQRKRKHREATIVVDDDDDDDANDSASDVNDPGNKRTKFSQNGAV